jgi:hypothetical protein
MTDHSVRAEACEAALAVVVADATRGHSSAGQSIGLRYRTSLSGRSPAEHFWSFVDRSGGPDACWPWTGGRDDDGYGRFCVDVATRPCVRAHRYVLELVGLEAFPWEDAAHKCDNPPCCNPAHLEPLSHRENMRQMAARGRARGGRTRRHVTTAVAASILLAGTGPEAKS